MKTKRRRESGNRSATRWFDRKAKALIKGFFTNSLKFRDIMEKLFFTDWKTMGHIAITTVISFLALFMFVRISGKRTLAKLNAFDFVVTVALGSTLAYMMLGLVPLAEGAEVLCLIIVMQYIFAWTARSSKKMERVINSVPRLLFYEGKFLKNAMAKEAITKDEIFAAIRSSGMENTHNIKAIVMEINGEITVIEKSAGLGVSALHGIATEAQE